MKQALRRVAAALVAASLAGSWSTTVRAEGAAAEEEYSERAPPVEEGGDVVAYVRTTPNVDAIAGGLFVFGLGYGGAVIAAAKSPLRADDRLYAPVVGPWLDLADRPDCGPGSARPACSMERTYRVLLVTSGIVQGLGALAAVGGLLFPKTEVVTTKPGVRVLPHAGAGNVGISAVGVF